MREIIRRHTRKNYDLLLADANGDPSEAIELVQILNVDHEMEMTALATAKWNEFLNEPDTNTAKINRNTPPNWGKTWDWGGSNSDLQLGSGVARLPGSRGGGGAPTYGGGYSNYQSGIGDTIDLTHLPKPIGGKFPEPSDSSKTPVWITVSISPFKPPEPPFQPQSTKADCLVGEDAYDTYDLLFQLRRYSANHASESYRHFPHSVRNLQFWNTEIVIQIKYDALSEEDKQEVDGYIKDLQSQFDYGFPGHWKKHMTVKYTPVV